MNSLLFLMYSHHNEISLPGSGLNFFTELFHHQDLQYGLIIAIFIGLLAGIVGSFSIMHGMSLLSDSLSHAVFPGIVLSIILGVPMIIGAGVFGAIAILFINLIRSRTKLNTDTAIGIIYPTFFAIGMILVAKNNLGDLSEEILFGDIFSITPQDLLMIVIVGLFVLFFIFTQYKKLQLLVFDENFAKQANVNVSLLETALTICLALVIIISLKAVGVILVTALLIIPASTAYLWSNSFKKMILISAIVGMLSAIFGFIISYQINIPSGPAIVLTSFVFFVASFIFKNLVSNKAN